MSTTSTPGTGPGTSQTTQRTTDTNPSSRSSSQAGVDTHAAAETLKHAGESARKEAEGLAEGVKARIREEADRGRQTGADTIHNVADAARSAADSLDENNPAFARYAREAASMVDEVSDAIRDRSTGDLIRSVDRFARREPVAFFGAALVAGFAAARFLGSSARHSHADTTDWRDSDRQDNRYNDRTGYGSGRSVYGTGSGYEPGRSSGFGGTTGGTTRTGTASGIGAGSRATPGFSAPESASPVPDPIRSAGLHTAGPGETPKPAGTSTLGRADSATSVGDGGPSTATGTPGATPDRPIR